MLKGSENCPKVILNTCQQFAYRLGLSFATGENLMHNQKLYEIGRGTAYFEFLKYKCAANNKVPIISSAIIYKTCGS